MKFRYVASKTFNSGVVTKTGTVNGTPMYSEVLNQYDNVMSDEQIVNVLDSLPDKVTRNSTLNLMVDFVKSDKLLRDIMLTSNDTVVPLCQQFGYKVGESSNLHSKNKDMLEEYRGITDLWDVLNNDSYKESLEKIAFEMFNCTNPLTGKTDVCSKEFYTHLIPIVSLTGIIPPHLTAESNACFNENGTVTIAEFLDSLNAIKFGSNSNSSRQKSVDSLVSDKDFFNEGYNSCVCGLSSPLYREYTRKELMQPITRIELAYITVLCWGDFVKKFGNINGGVFETGINTSWDAPGEYLCKFDDGFNYKVCRKVFESNKDVVSLNIGDYRGELSMSDYKSMLRDGARAIPLPMIMSLIELDALDLFYFKDDMLSPLAEVSRGEWCYFIVKLARVFKTRFISSDKSYN